MDVLAAMFAYLGCVTGIVGALAISFFVFFSAPNQQIMAKNTVVIAAKSNKLNTALVSDVKPAPAPVVAKTDVAKVEVDKVEIVPPPKIAANARTKTLTSSAQLRRLVQEERARRFAYQQDADFDARFLGYAD
jgi:hypothetical protein